MTDDRLASGTRMTGKRGSAIVKKRESLERARVQYEKLLRARIADAERTLGDLRAELARLGGTPTTRRSQACSHCGHAGHTKRTCPERATINAGDAE